MSPTANQRAATSDHEYESEPEKLVAEKNELTLLAVLRGCQDPKRAEAFARAEAQSEGTRRRVVGKAYSRAKELRDEIDPEPDSQRGESAA